MGILQKRGFAIPEAAREREREDYTYCASYIILLLFDLLFTVTV
jgi:hypothetical protein